MAAEKATRRTTSIAISIGKSDPVPGLLAPWARSQAVAMHHLCCLLLAIAVLFRPLRLRTWIPCFMTAAQTPANRTLAMKHCCRCLNAPAVPGREGYSVKDKHEVENTSRVANVVARKLSSAQMPAG